MQYPEGYSVTEDNTVKDNDICMSDEDDEAESSKTRKRKGKKRRKFLECAQDKKSVAKKPSLGVTDTQRSLLEADTENEKLWDQLFQNKHVNCLSVSLSDPV
jgi:hypothetical protein